MMNDKPGHYCIGTTANTPVEKNKGLLEDLGLKRCG